MPNLKRLDPAADVWEMTLEGGERFTGTLENVTIESGKAQENTKRWGQGFKQELDTLKSAPQPPAPQEPPAANNLNELPVFILEQLGQAVGMSGQQYKDKMARADRVIGQLEQQDAIAHFLRTCPEFSNNPTDADILEKKMQERGKKFDDTDALIATHRMCLADGAYQPLQPQHQNVTATSTFPSSTPTPPPLVTGSTVPQSNPQNEYNMPIDQLRAQLLKTPLNS